MSQDKQMKAVSPLLQQVINISSIVGGVGSLIFCIWAYQAGILQSKETLSAFIQPTDILVISALADDGLDKGSPIEAHQIKDNGTADDDADIVVDRTDDVTVDKDPSHRGQGPRNDRDDRL